MERGERERRGSPESYLPKHAEKSLSWRRGLALAPRRGAHLLIRGYQLSLSMLIGRQCRHWPSCSEYTDEAIQRHGLWAGGWVGFARICRCTPLGTSGIDMVCEELPPEGAWYKPWAYGRWRGVNGPAS
ncbi:membrane protein insertion efficiency factor YidD [Bosea sp. NPDC003192]|uniref:membrane protein insertion efficiency factor YidD n=1 Tax=Bosea sp. NPDC003192 TaxID=3390551 RepID=UPI003D0102C6